MGYESKSSSFSARGTRTVPLRLGDIGGLTWGVDGAVRVPETPVEVISKRELARDGGAEPENVENCYENRNRL